MAINLLTQSILIITLPCLAALLMLRYFNAHRGYEPNSRALNIVVTSRVLLFAWSWLWSTWILQRIDIPLENTRLGIVYFYACVNLVMWLPLIIQSLIVSLITFSIVNHLKRVDVSRKQLIWNAAMKGTWFILLAVPLEAAFGEYQVGHFRGALGLIIFSAGVAQFKSTTLWLSTGMLYTNVPRGSFHDRLHGLAKQFSVSVKCLLFAKSKTTAAPNAFVSLNRCVMVTDTLLDELSTDEVDTIIAHELAHIKLKHLLSRVVLFGVSVAILVNIVLWNIGSTSIALLLGELYATGFIVYLALLWFSRRNEFAADHMAVSKFGNPHQFITALAKLGGDRGMPLTWNRIVGLFLTHPPTNERITRIAKAGGLSSKEVWELVGSEQIEPTGHYSVPVYQRAFAVLSTDPTSIYLKLASGFGQQFLVGALPILFGVENIPFVVIAAILGWFLHRAIYNWILRRDARARINSIARSDKSAQPHEHIVPVIVSPPRIARPLVSIGFYDAMEMRATKSHLIFHGKEIQFQVGRADLQNLTPCYRDFPWASHNRTDVWLRGSEAGEEICFSLLAVPNPLAFCPIHAHTELKDLLLKWLDHEELFPPALPQEIQLPSLHHMVNTKQVNYGLVGMKMKTVAVWSTLFVMLAVAIVKSFPDDMIDALVMLSLLTPPLGILRLKYALRRETCRKPERNPMGATGASSQ